MIQPRFIQLEAGIAGEFPLDLLSPSVNTNYIGYILGKSPERGIETQKVIECNYIMVPILFSREELNEKLPEFIKVMESEAIPYKKPSKFSTGWESYRRGNKRYYFRQSAFVAPFRDEKYGLGYLEQFQIEELK